jgi:hypothetical protein
MHYSYVEFASQRRIFIFTGTRRAQIHNIQVSVRMLLRAQLNLSRTLVSLPDSLFLVHLPSLVYKTMIVEIFLLEVKSANQHGREL